MQNTNLDRQFYPSLLLLRKVNLSEQKSLEELGERMSTRIPRSGAEDAFTRRRFSAVPCSAISANPAG
jgi:hypothetical protein